VGWIPARRAFYPQSRNPAPATASGPVGPEWNVEFGVPARCGPVSSIWTS